jgi:hypothetical protein
MFKVKAGSIETSSFSMQDVRALCGQDPPLEQRQAIHLMQTEAVNPDHLAAASLKKRFYGFSNLLQFEVGRILFVGFGVAPQSVKAIMRALQAGGFFLRSGQKDEIRKDSRRFGNPAEFREHLNAVYDLGLYRWTSPYTASDVGGVVERVPRSASKLQSEIRHTAAMATRLAHNGPRPWPYYVLVFRKGSGWDFDVGMLPGQHYIESAGKLPRLKVDEASFKHFSDLVTAHPGAILLNLFEIEHRLRCRFDEQQGGSGAVEESEEHG